MNTTPTPIAEVRIRKTAAAAKPRSAAHLIFPKSPVRTAPAPVAPPASRSAANIHIRKKAVSAPPIGQIALIPRLRRLVHDCGPNRNDAVIAAITACIGEGVNTIGGIIAVLIKVGFNGGHVARFVKSEAGDHPDRHRWRKEPDGTYALHV
ncbi:hypothetical protein [Sphingomonas sp. CFBP 13720]|uniref:hypothetical protein n=1 Tax=Sphingomonas sp. CFBP 13720 TaxID=2775302 RepID=UPI00177EED2C|nr:hypothetical protein [Sphingomonas sp. CFBP 13720]MBD8679657.1 hypothetical protein [Sphingomonas sp. CFBP 13720]